MNEIKRRGRLNGKERLRLKKLLDMLYTPHEIANEIGFSRNQFYSVYLIAGCPKERDANNRIVVNGKQFREWYEKTYPHTPLNDNEAFCVTCKKAVVMNKPILEKSGRLSYWLSSCATCGRKLVKIISMEKMPK